MEFAAEAEGVEALFHAPGAPDDEHTQTAALEVPGRGERIVHLVLAGSEAGAAGNVTVTMRTGLGGLVQQHIAYEVVEPGAAEPTSPGAESPLPVALAMLAVLSCLLRRRR